jgi:hypothetical protein
MDVGTDDSSDDEDGGECTINPNQINDSDLRRQEICDYIADYYVY